MSGDTTIYGAMAASYRAINHEEHEEHEEHDKRTFVLFVLFVAKHHAALANMGARPQTRKRWHCTWPTATRACRGMPAWLRPCVVAYAFSPIDLIPDFIPVLGLLDDVILVPLGIALARRLIPPAVMAECRAQALVLAERPISRVGAVLDCVGLAGIGGVGGAVVAGAARSVSCDAN